MPHIQEEKLISKKNNVYKRECLINGKKQLVIEKEFTDIFRYYVEKRIVKKLRITDLSVPKFLFARDPANNGKAKIVYTYVEGITALDFIEQNNPLQCKFLLKEITQWLDDFYSIAKMILKEQWILGDIHLRNFIYNTCSNRLYGFDFENACPGKIEKDIAKLFLYIATYDPAYSPKNLDLSACFVSNAAEVLNLEKLTLIKEMYAEASDMSNRRHICVDKDLLASIIDANIN